jgi:hypothetical protein
VRLERIAPGRRPPSGLVGGILARDLVVAGERWEKGRRLSAADLAALAREPGPGAVGGRGGSGARRDGPVTVIVPDPDEVHEDEAALRLARAVAGSCLALRGPSQSRVDLVAEVAGVVHVDVAAIERLDRIDPLEAFTLFDGQVVSAGDLVASVKVAPHVVPAAVLERGEAVARRAGRGRGLVRVAPFAARRVGVLVKETLLPAARERFERSVREKVEGLGSELAAIDYVGDDEEAAEAALRRFAVGRERVDLILTAGAGSTDPADAFFVALERLGGRVVRHGVPAHPGSMLWLGRLRRSAIIGLPTCGAYSKATAADLLLPRLLSGDPPTAATVARLGHGGILGRDMRFRFPPYARRLDAPDG